MKTEREWSIDELATLESVRSPTTRPPEANREIRVLDIFSGPGGVGYALRTCFTQPNARGWFMGVDTTDYADRYPGRFRQADATDLTLADLGLEEPVDCVWLSPPCQAYSKLSHVHYDDPKEHFPTFDDLGVHDLAERLGREYVIENVVGCDDLENPTKLTGSAFDQRFIYERWFETSFQVPDWRPPTADDAVRMDSVGEREYAQIKGVPHAAEWDKTEIRSAIPPVYVGYLLSHCPTLPEIEPPGGVDEYRKLGAGDGQMWLSEFGTDGQLETMTDGGEQR